MIVLLFVLRAQLVLGGVLECRILQVRYVRVRQNIINQWGSPYFHHKELTKNTLSDQRWPERFSGSTALLHHSAAVLKTQPECLQLSFHVSGKGKWYRVWCSTSLFPLTVNPMPCPCGAPLRTPQSSLTTSRNAFALILKRPHWLALFTPSDVSCKQVISVRIAMGHIIHFHDNFLKSFCYLIDIL